MADRTANKIYKTQGGYTTQSYVIADGVTIGIGALVQLEGGYLNHWDETDQFVGVLIGGDDRAKDGVITGETSDIPPPEGRVAIGATVMHIAVDSATAASVGKLVYASTGDSDIANLSVTDSTNPPVGRIVRFRSASDCDVRFFTPDEWLAGDAGATWAS